MLLKWRGHNPFIFVANTKSASNSIETSKLARIADVRLTEPRVGKHMSLEKVYDRFDFIFEAIDFDDFFKFGVVRDPLQWLVSWFNFRARSELADPTHRSHANYTGAMDFSEFWDRYKDRSFLDPQVSRFFSGSNERIKPDYLIRHDKLVEGLAVVRESLRQSPLKLWHLNTTGVKKIDVGDVDDCAREQILEKYSRDYALLEKLDSYNADRLERFRARPRRDTNAQAGTVNTLKKLVRDTSLESPARSVVYFLKGIKRS